MDKRIIIAGPTASGKSSLAVELALRMDGEIISADSRQCYRQINIGTAKPTDEQLSLVPHHNISILDLEEEDSAQAFYERCTAWISEIEKRGKTAIIAGGSTLHLQSLVRPFDDLPSSSEKNIKTLQQQLNENGTGFLYEKLKSVDPDYAESMDGQNQQRIIRALDVWMQTGKPFSSFHSNREFEEPEGYTVFALHWPRKMLHRRIEQRCDEMLKAGLMDETKSLLDAGFSKNLQSLQTVGYRQVIQFLNGEIGREQMEKDFKTATRRYAKRQITWLRRWPFVIWLDASENSIEMLASQVQEQVAADAKNR